MVKTADIRRPGESAGAVVTEAAAFRIEFRRFIASTGTALAPLRLRRPVQHQAAPVSGTATASPPPVS